MLFATPVLGDRELEVLDQIDAAKHKLRHQLHEPRRWVGQLRRQAFARAVQGSNSIEGYIAQLDDADAIAAGDEPLDVEEETRLAIRGCSEAMTYVLQLAKEEDFSYSTQLIKSLHFMMTSYDLRNRPGRWRAGAIYVQQEETGDIVYEGPDVDEVPGTMGELAARLATENGCIDMAGGGPALVRAAMSHLNLVMIHPFKDGNGRMARCLQSLVLAREGVLSPVFMSVEEYLGRNTVPYYGVLAEVGKGAWHPDHDARPWMRFMLTAHIRQAHTHLRRVRESELIWIGLERIVTRYRLPERMLTVLFDATTGYRVRNQTYRTALERSGEEEITEATASRDLRQLAETGLLVPRGEKRGRLYVAGAELLQLRQEIVQARHLRDDTDPFAGAK